MGQLSEFHIRPHLPLVSLYLARRRNVSRKRESGDALRDAPMKPKPEERMCSIQHTRTRLCLKFCRCEAGGGLVISFPVLVEDEAINRATLTVVPFRLQLLL